MWCKVCDAVVNCKEKCTATAHCKSAKHLAMLKKRPLVVTTPGLAVQPKMELQVVVRS